MSPNANAVFRRTPLRNPPTLIGSGSTSLSSYLFVFQTQNVRSCSPRAGPCSHPYCVTSLFVFLSPSASETLSRWRPQFFCDPPISPLCFVWGGASSAESCVRRAPLCFLLLPTIISFHSLAFFRSSPADLHSRPEGYEAFTLQGVDLVPVLPEKRRVCAWKKNSFLSVR